MIISSDPLSDRATEWMAEITQLRQSDDLIMLRGLGLCELLKRRGTSARGLIESVERQLDSATLQSLPSLVEHTIRCWNHLLADLDREEANLEHVRRQAQDVFFSVLEALVLIEARGTSADAPAARQLFNAVIHDLYVFEPMADQAAQLVGEGYEQLSNLLCAGVAGLYNGQAPELRPEPVESVEEFVPLEAFLRRSPGESLSDLLASVTWYLKWTAQVIKMTVTGSDLKLTVCEAPQSRASQALDGWQIRLTHARQIQETKFVTGAATLKLPHPCNPAQLAILLKGPGQTEWGSLFARVEAH
jgi:hypothetical protein